MKNNWHNTYIYLTLLQLLFCDWLYNFRLEGEIQQNRTWDAKIMEHQVRIIYIYIYTTLTRVLNMPFSFFSSSQLKSCLYTGNMHVAFFNQNFKCLGLFSKAWVVGLYVSGNYSYKGESSASGVVSNSKNTTSTNYHHQNETVEPSYYSSSIYYGGQENYSPRTRTTESHHSVSALIPILYHDGPCMLLFCQKDNYLIYNIIIKYNLPQFEFNYI